MEVWKAGKSRGGVPGWVGADRYGRGWGERPRWERV